MLLEIKSDFMDTILKLANSISVKKGIIYVCVVLFQFHSHIVLYLMQLFSMTEIKD